MDLKDAVPALSALAHEGRLAAFRLLVEAGPDGLAAGRLAERLGVPPNTLSANLNILSHAGLIVARRTGRSIIYSSNIGQMRALIGFLIQDCCSGAPELCAPLADLLAESEGCDGS
jgi:ArsR family transcriptional regulator, arsenate/arsenite/antimonite-responsive transcriptional repressor